MSKRVVPEFEKDYPEPSRMGIMPSYGFFIRHVDGIKMNDVEVGYLGKEVRPAIIMNDVNGADFFRIKTKPVTNTNSIVLKSVENFSIQQSEGFKNKTIKKADDISF